MTTLVTFYLKVQQYGFPVGTPLHRSASTGIYFICDAGEKFYYLAADGSKEPTLYGINPANVSCDDPLSRKNIGILFATNTLHIVFDALCGDTKAVAGHSFLGNNMAELTVCVDASRVAEEDVKEVAMTTIQEYLEENPRIHWQFQDDGSISYRNIYPLDTSLWHR